MSEQLDINGGSQPLTWDGEPLYSVETVREGLFDPEPFQQMPGQTALELVVCSCCLQDFFTDTGENYCPRCMEPKELRARGWGEGLRGYPEHWS